MKHVLDVATKNHLISELGEHTFIRRQLHKLLQSPFYYTLSEHTIILRFIPVSKFNLKDATKLMKRLVFVAKQEHVDHPIHMWIVPCNSKRYFPKCTDEMFDKKHINGGYTYYTSATHDTYIYRLEDLQKVAIHELLHNTKLDKTNTDATELLEPFRISPHSPYPLLVNEASTEAWAMFYHLNCVADEYKLQFKDLFNKELEFSLALSHKLQGYHKGLWKENTNAYAYIRLKTCIMFYWSKFRKCDNLVEFLKKYNNAPKFVKAINRTEIPKGNSCKITLYGSI
jgi:hypothetical protein